MGPGRSLLSLLLLAAASAPADGQESLPLSPGLVITRSATIEPGRYVLPAGDSPAAIRIVGDDITVDFAGAELVGAAPGMAPDRFAGIGILIEGGRNVTVANARVHGFKVGLLARGSPGLRVTGGDFSYNWRSRLWSGIEQESLVDWLTYHKNDADEWLRYGAGIYLAACDSARVDHTTIVQGQNGLLVTRSTGLTIWNNTFTHLSGLGIGLYRTSGSRIQHNRVDWAIRGYSQGFYNRGQDSAGILVYEQSGENVIAYNSVTHGGDGLFLWAGQTTMDSGAGGANGNLIFGNDFSHAATNGMEATFSRNNFVANRIDESAHGLWGGYSYGSRVIGNRFAGNRVGIAIEHGQDNVIAHNTFAGDTTAISLWWNAIEPSDWGYPQHRDTRSRDVAIHDNAFDGSRTALRLDDTGAARVTRNRFLAVDTLAVLSGALSDFLFDGNAILWTTPAVRDSTTTAPAFGTNAWWTPGPPGDRMIPGQAAEAVAPAMTINDAPGLVDSFAPPPLPGAIDPLLPPGARRGRRHIIVDGWGPYDFRSPKLWPEGRGDASPLPLRVLGPPGRWRVASLRGVTALSADSGPVPGVVTVTLPPGTATDWALELEYIGAAVTTPFGEAFPAGARVPFGYRRFVPAITWRVRVVSWDSLSDPRTMEEAFAARLRAAPLLALETPRLEYMWYRPRLPGLPLERWALTAESTVELPPGAFELQTISDDGVRVWVDGALVIDRWTPHESLVATAPLTGGRHAIRVEYYQVDGWVELRVDVQPASVSDGYRQP
ncbi:MAG: right-handed parallel beta-helix repeat-containing protein [Gemmatimonadota bacterium]